MSDALDKRIRGVYDAFEHHNYKLAIKLSNAGIQKYPHVPVLQSLKAVALARTGKLNEALQLAEALLAAAPPDDHVLNMLLLVLKPADRVGDLLPAYEAAVQKQPGNEDLLHGLFACHARAFDFAGQQQAAMRLNKQHPNELYQWWVVTSLALQAHAAAVAGQLGSAGQPANAAAAAAPAGGLAPDKLLQLAEAMAGRLLAKAPAPGSHHSWESVMLYLGLLQAQGKQDAALSALRGPLACSFSISAEQREAEAALLLSKGELQAAAALYEAALQEQPDDWGMLLLYLDCLLPGTAASLPACSSTAVAQMVTGVEASTRPGCQVGGLQALLSAMAVGEPAAAAAGAPSVQERLARADAFITNLAAQQAPDAAAGAAGAAGADGLLSTTGGVTRGPALAAVELVKRRLQLGLASESELVAALLAYHQQYGHVVSCAMDVVCYLQLLGASSRQQHAEQLSERAEAAAATAAQQEQEQGSSSRGQLRLLRTRMSARQIQADLGSPAFADAGAAASHAEQLMREYAAAQPLYEGMDERERGPADELLWQAAAALVQAARLQAAASSTTTTATAKQAAMPHLVSSLLVLEAGAKGRPYCAPVRLGLTGLHGLLGNAEAAGRHFRALDIKHVQHDTLSSQHLLPLLRGLGAGAAAGQLLAATCALFEDHLKDAGDSLMHAFSAGTYTKVLEFVCFKERLQRSHSFVLARAERALLAISTAAMSAAGGSSGSSGGNLAAAGAAVAMAVRQLPLAALDALDWRGMRFNDDLTTRLPWLPPTHGPRHLVVLLWWEQQAAAAASTAGDGGAQWWRQVAAAEADAPEAAALRASMAAAAQQRWLLPHLLHAALQVGGSSSSSSSSSAGDLDALLSCYASVLSCSSLSGLEAELAACWGATAPATAAAAPPPPASRQLQLLDAALFTLARSLQLLLAPSDAADGAPSGDALAAAATRQAATLAAGLQQLQQHVEREMRPDAAYLGSLLPGDVLSLAALLLHESCAWLLLCLEAWCKAVKQSRKRATKKGSGEPPAALESAAPAAAALAQLQGALAALLGALAAGADSLLAQPPAAAAAGLLAAFDDSSNAAVRALVGWEPRASVQLVLSDAVGQQHALLVQLRDAAKRAAGRAAALAGSW